MTVCSLTIVAVQRVERVVAPVVGSNILDVYVIARATLYICSCFVRRNDPEDYPGVCLYRSDSGDRMYPTYPYRQRNLTLWDKVRIT
jgi:hypothetical protein